MTVVESARKLIVTSSPNVGPLEGKAINPTENRVRPWPYSYDWPPLLLLTIQRFYCWLRLTTPPDTQTDNRQYGNSATTWGKATTLATIDSAHHRHDRGRETAAVAAEFVPVRCTVASCQGHEHRSVWAPWPQAQLAAIVRTAKQAPMVNP